MINTTIRLTKVEKVSLLPDIEHFAGESFRALPDLAWIADYDIMSVETHLGYVTKGTSWAAEVDGLIVGFLCAEIIESDLHIWLLAVRQERQGKGIGWQLMNTAIEYAHHNWLRSVTMITFREVPWNEPFYRSLGFEIIDAEKMEPRLEEILQEEIQHGIPGDMRCAMRLLVSAASGKDA